jgi:hypothetical protein
MAGIEKDHWLWNTRANDTGSIMECYSLFIQSVAERQIYGLLPELLNLLSLVRLRTSLHSRRHGVTITGFAGYRLSGWSPTQAHMKNDVHVSVNGCSNFCSDTI